MNEIYTAGINELINRSAPTLSTILITGESGTGKELVAREIHQKSSRCSHPLITVNCAAIPDDLIESEFFGVERGAFTGAFTARLGRFEIAHHGTVFLDEIGDLSHRAQTKLLRVLEYGTFEPLGTSKVKHVDVRIIAATNRDLSQDIDSGRFREDLFYRLAIIRIHIPALRDRINDIPLFIKSFTKEFRSKGYKDVKFSDSAITSLLTYKWPGNIRELKNVIERLIVLAPDDGVIGIKEIRDFGGLMASAEQIAQSTTTTFGPGGIDFYESIRALKRQLIDRALILSNGNQRAAARLLRMNRTTLVEHIRKLRKNEGKVIKLAVVN